jgi:hypothetical protein
MSEHQEIAAMLARLDEINVERRQIEEVIRERYLSEDPLAKASMRELLGLPWQSAEDNPMPPVDHWPGYFLVIDRGGELLIAKIVLEGEMEPYGVLEDDKGSVDWKYCMPITLPNDR